jgi:hypothetical protein
MLVKLALVAVGGTTMVAAGAQAAPVGSGAFFGGFTADEFPVVVEMSKSGRKVVRVGLGHAMTCTSGGEFALPVWDENLKVSAKRRFSRSSAVTVRNDDGTTTDVEVRHAGAFNKARTKVTGTWSSKMTTRDTAGAVTDTCESGTVRWSAKQ